MARGLPADNIGILLKENTEMTTTANKTEGLLSRPPVARLTHWDEQFRQMFGEFVAEALSPSCDGHRPIPFGSSTSPPDMDLYEHNNELVVKAELPGMEEEDIQVNFSDCQLFLKGDKKRDTGLKEENYYFSECSYGPFLRILDLPSDVEVEKARRTFKKGILEIRLPKTAEIKKETIPIRVK